MSSPGSGTHLPSQRHDTAASGTLSWADTIGLIGYSPYLVYNVLDEPQNTIPTKTTTLHNDMSAYFTQHHFPPRWSRNSFHDLLLSSQTPTGEGHTTTSQHEPGNHHGLDVLAKFLHAFNAHYDSSEDGHNVVHPHFDLVETKTAYYVYGELPGLTRDDLIVESNDHLFVVIISGVLKRSVPAGVSAVAGTDSSTIGVVHRDSQGSPTEAKKPEGEGEAGGEGGATGLTGEIVSDAKESKEPSQELHWHVTERKVGKFRRAFQFPIEQVEMNALQASMKDGVMCLTVPKRLGENKKLTELRKVEVVEAGVQSHVLAAENP